jgi:RNA polymerase sigma-70 factor (ECF subfamily)
MSISQDQFAAVWDADSPRVLAYARRHVGVSDAPDIVSETFAVAWRRWDAVPDPPTPWLIGTARKIILSHHRAVTRRIALTQRLQLLDAVAAQPPDPWLATRLCTGSLR